MVWELWASWERGHGSGAWRSRACKQQPWDLGYSFLPTLVLKNASNRGKEHKIKAKKKKKETKGDACLGQHLN